MQLEIVSIMERETSPPPGGGGGGVGANKRRLSIEPDPESAYKVSLPSASAQDTNTDPYFTDSSLT